MTEKLRSMRQQHDDRAAKMRKESFQTLEGSARAGWIPQREERANKIRAAFNEVGFNLVPNSGWSEFCYELDIVFVVFPEAEDRLGVGNAAMARMVERESESLAACEKRVRKIYRGHDLIHAASPAIFEIRKVWEGIREARQALDAISLQLRASPQGPKWREKFKREFRIRLAISVSSLFEKEFGTEAKPDGGSAALPLADANDWTKFFQACALVLLDERASPDRQAILWEAHSHG